MPRRHQSIQLLPPCETAAPEKDNKAQTHYLPDCPFCDRDDDLEIINWSNERADGSEFIGEAVRCNRCDAIAPLAAWLNLFKTLPTVLKPAGNLSQD